MPTPASLKAKSALSTLHPCGWGEAGGLACPRCIEARPRVRTVGSSRWEGSWPRPRGERAQSPEATDRASKPSGIDGHLQPQCRALSAVPPSQGSLRAIPVAFLRSDSSSKRLHHLSDTSAKAGRRALQQECPASSRRDQRKPCLAGVAEPK